MNYLSNNSQKSVILISCILLCLFLTTSCSKKGDPQDPITASTTNTQDEGVGNVMATATGSAGFVLPAEKPIIWKFPVKMNGDWANIQPYIDLMGEEDAYSAYAHETFGELYFEGYDLTMTPFDRKIYGEIFDLSIPFDTQLNEEENRQFILDLRRYVESSGGLVVGLREDALLFQAFDASGNRWWCHADIEYEQFDLTIVRENELKVDEPVVIDIGGLEPPYIIASYSNGDVYQTLKAQIEGGDLLIDIKSKNQFMSYKRSFDKSYDLFEASGETYYIGDLPNEPGPTTYELYWYEESKPDMIELTLSAPYRMEAVKYGESLGALKISAAYANDISVTPTGGNALYIDHPDYDMESNYLDLTPDGDYIIYVPSGLWDVRVTPKDAPLLAYYEILSVPVNSGEITELSVPYAIASSLSVKAQEVDMRGIEIQRFSEDTSKDQVTFEFSLLDASTKGVNPDTDNLSVSEGGKSVEVLSVEKVNQAPDVVLLLDSSGSMKGNFETLIASAKAFIQKLPTGTHIQVVDFDDTVKVLPGTTQAEALKVLGQMKVGGDTALYNAVDEGLGLLDEKERPILVVFTDGKNDLPGHPSESLERVLSKVKTADTPVFTIGFGKGHDSSALLLMANESNGRYFNAEDGQMLTKVFEAINARISATYEVTYQRPVEASLGDNPVLTFLIDTSGSMSEIDESGGERMRNLKTLLFPFIMDLPKTVEAQIMGFESNTYGVQSVTTDQIKLLRAVDKLMADGSTDIPSAVLAGLESLKATPSTKKMMVFITDEALNPEEPFFQEMCGSLKAEGIRVLWVGMGMPEDVTPAFAKAAELTGGSYVVSSDVNVLKRAFNDLLDKVMALPQTNLSQVAMTLEKENASGEREAFGTSKLTPLSPIKKSSAVITTQTVSHKNGGPLAQYDAKLAASISGTSIPSLETIVTGRMKIDKEKSGPAVAFDIHELVFMSKLYNVEAPTGYRFMAVDLSLRNVLPKQKVTVYPDGSGHPSSWIGGDNAGTEVEKVPEYLIPDFTAHFFVQMNDQGSFGASQATWLAANPITQPGEVSLSIKPNQIQDGVLIFLVPDEPIANLSLHLYDVAYGSLHMPVIGKMSPQSEDVDKLPTDTLSALSDTFDLSLIGYKDYKVESVNNAFRSVEVTFISNQQALLSIDPAERIKLAIQTNDGNYLVDLHPKTAAVPFGHYAAQLVGPGANNYTRWLFEMPQSLTKAPSSVVINLQGDDSVLPLIGQPTGRKLNVTGESVLSGEGVKIKIHSAIQLTQDSGDVSEGSVVVDMTVYDEEDGLSTTGLIELFNVVDPSSDQNAYISAINSRLLLSFKEETVVLDGMAQRGFIVFETGGAKADWHLKSSYFEVLDKLVTQGLSEGGLLTIASEYTHDDGYDDALSEAISARVIAFEREMEESLLSLDTGLIALEPKSVPDVEYPSFATFGAKKLSAIDTLEELKSVLKGLKFVPTKRSLGAFENIYSPEAVLTQNFGTYSDYGVLTMQALSKLGYQPKMKNILLTEEGRKSLETFSGIKDVNTTVVPGIAFEAYGEPVIWVMPFVEKLSDLRGLVVYDDDQFIDPESEKVTLTIALLGVDSVVNQNEQVSDMGDALAGETDKGERLSEIILVTESINLDLLSLDAIDVGFTEQGMKIKPYLITPDGIILGEMGFDSHTFKPKKLVITISDGGNDNYVHHTNVVEGQNLEDLFVTLSINAPELPETSVDAINTYRNALQDKVPLASDISTLRWFTRSRIQSFVEAQTAHEHMMAESYGLILGNTNKLRVIVLSVHAIGTDKIKMTTTIDLVSAITEVQGHIDSETKKNDADALDFDALSRSFNLMSGLYATSVEETAIGKDGIGVYDVMNATPEGTELVFLEPYLESETLEGMITQGMPESLASYFKENGNWILIPNQPAMIDGQKRWAWIEFNPETYEAIGVLDTTEKGAMVSSVIIDTVKGAGQFMVGAFVGINSSVWTVAAYSLEEDDYETILKNAKAFALGLKTSFGLQAGPIKAPVGGMVNLSTAYGPVVAKFDGTGKITQNALGFTQGYEAGVNYYFSNTK